MVVGLVLEHHQPGFLLAVNLRLHLDGAGVDFLRGVQILQFALALQRLCADGPRIHQAEGLSLASQFLPNLQVFFEGGPDGGAQGGVRSRQLHLVQAGVEGGVAAVVGPVGVDDLDFREGGLPVFLVPEILLDEGQVLGAHGQSQGAHHFPEFALWQGEEALHHPDVGRGLGGNLQGVRLHAHDRLPALHRVDDVSLHPAELLVGEVAQQGV